MNYDEYKGKKVFAFDLDDTLTPSRSDMTSTMIPVFEKLLKNKKVAIVSGASWDQINKQVLRHLSDNTVLDNLYVLPNNSAIFLEYKNRQWEKWYSNDLSEEEIQKIQDELNKALDKCNFDFSLPIHGERFENRGGTVFFRSSWRRRST